MPCHVQKTKYIYIYVIRSIYLITDELFWTVTGGMKFFTSKLAQSLSWFWISVMTLSTLAASLSTRLRLASIRPDSGFHFDLQPFQQIILLIQQKLNQSTNIIFDLLLQGLFFELLRYLRFSIKASSWTHVYNLHSRLYNHQFLNLYVCKVSVGTTELSYLDISFGLLVCALYSRTHGLLPVQLDESQLQLTLHIKTREKSFNFKC